MTIEQRAHRHFNQLRDRYTFQAFEIEDISDRKNYIIVYNPYNRTVTTYINLTKGHEILMVAKDGFKLACEPHTTFNDIYDYFVWTYKKSTSLKNSNTYLFIGWVDAATHQPYEDESNYFTLSTLSEKAMALGRAKEQMLNVIKDIKVRELINIYGYFAGGCISSVIKRELVNDYDIFIKDKEALLKIKDYFTSIYDDTTEITILRNGRYKRLSKKNIGSYGDLELLVTDRAITFGKYQIILVDSGEPVDVLNRFDFVHSMCAYDFQEDFIYISQYVYSKIKQKDLVYNLTSDTPLTSWRRMIKFARQGWNCSKLQSTKLLLKVYDYIHDCEMDDNVDVRKEIESMANMGYYEIER